MKTKKSPPKRRATKWTETKIKSEFIILKKVSKDRYDHEINYQLIKKTTPTSQIVVIETCGHMDINKDGSISSVEINKSYRGKGIGKYLYEQVLLDNKKLINNPSSTSPEARRVHKSLMKKWAHKIDVFGEEKGSSEGNIIYYPKLKKEYQEKLKK